MLLRVRHHETLQIRGELEIFGLLCLQRILQRRAVIGRSLRKSNAGSCTEEPTVRRSSLEITMYVSYICEGSCPAFYLSKCLFRRWDDVGADRLLRARNCLLWTSRQSSLPHCTFTRGLFSHHCSRLTMAPTSRLTPLALHLYHWRSHQRRYEQSRVLREIEFQ